MDSELGILQTKGRFYNSKYKRWPFGDLEGEWNKKFDNMICYCANEDGTLIERVYIFQKEEIIGRQHIIIYNNESSHWYDKYLVTDLEHLKKVNEIWNSIIENKKEKKNIKR